MNSQKLVEKIDEALSLLPNGWETTDLVRELVVTLLPAIDDYAQERYDEGRYDGYDDAQYSYDDLECCNHD